VTASPKNKKAIIAAKIGDVLLRKASFDIDINLTAKLNMKNVIVPVIDLIIIIFQYEGGTSIKLTSSLKAIA
jgi:hypothetical protein